jgi:hypothetical protein
LIASKNNLVESGVAANTAQRSRRGTLKTASMRHLFRSLALPVAEIRSHGPASVGHQLALAALLLPLADRTRFPALALALSFLKLRSDRIGRSAKLFLAFLILMTPGPGSGCIPFLFARPDHVD